MAKTTKQFLSVEDKHNKTTPKTDGLIVNLVKYQPLFKSPKVVKISFKTII